MDRRDFMGKSLAVGAVSSAALAARRALAGPATHSLPGAAPALEKSIEETPVILEVAISGSTTRAVNPLVPETAEEQAAEIIKCLDAGATIVHVHSNQPNEDVKLAAQSYLEIFKPVWDTHPHAILYPTANFDPKTYNRTRRPWPGKVQCGHQRILAKAGVVSMVLFDNGVVPLGVYDRQSVPGPDSALDRA